MAPKKFLAHLKELIKLIGKFFLHLLRFCKIFRQETVSLSAILNLVLPHRHEALK